MSDTDDLLAWLRSQSGVDARFGECANLIGQLTDRLAEMDDLACHLKAVLGEQCERADDIAELEAENARLRGALQTCLDDYVGARQQALEAAEITRLAGNVVEQRRMEVQAAQIEPRIEKIRAALKEPHEEAQDTQ